MKIISALWPLLHVRHVFESEMVVLQRHPPGPPQNGSCQGQQFFRPGDGERYAESARDTSFYSIGSLGGRVHNAGLMLLA